MPRTMGIRLTRTTRGVDAMKPDTSDWRNEGGYDFLDTLAIEGLAWECLRRSRLYQDHYARLASASTETLPLPHEAQQRWGLRFRRKTQSFSDAAASGVVAIEQSGPHHADAAARLPAPGRQ
ncbi:transcriptional regulator domain-containing protein [Sphingomonas pseudosanguinis]|uniref:transcriptional regulator domain-containing protein n=2 Tax=Sphingomonas pseudosanguinis TaxID=413712 RepID=UPI003CC82D0F